MVRATQATSSELIMQRLARCKDNVQDWISESSEPTLDGRALHWLLAKHRAVERKLALGRGWWAPERRNEQTRVESSG